MNTPRTSAWQRVCKLGQSIAMTGGVLCVTAMMIGLFGMVGLIIFGDPEDPHKLYGKFSSGVCILFCAGLLIGLIGFFLFLCQDKEQANETNHSKRSTRK